MHGFRRTLFLSHLGLVALTLLLLALTLRGLALKFFEAQLRDQIIIREKLGEGVIETARGFGYRVRS